MSTTVRVAGTILPAITLAASLPMAAPAAAQFFFIIPIPHSSANPDKISATSGQRKLAMCAAYHQSIVDPDIDGTRATSWHGDIAHAVMERLADYPDAKKLIGAYIGQWMQQQKMSIEVGGAYSRILTEGCNSANLPGNRIQYDYWKALPPGATGKAASLDSIPASPIKLDGLITAADLPAGFHGAKPAYVTKVTLEISRSGQVTDCTVAETSGADPLDEATCALLKDRARFRPALAGGRPDISDYAYTQTWQMP